MAMMDSFVGLIQMHLLLLHVIASPKPCTTWCTGRRAWQSRFFLGLLRRPAKRGIPRNDTLFFFVCISLASPIESFLLAKETAIDYT